jgi:hypothetical protein
LGISSESFSLVYRFLGEQFSSAFGQG